MKMFNLLKIKLIKGEQIMGLFSGINAMRALKSLREGKKAYLSIEQITNLLINLADASKNLNDQQFQDIYKLYTVHIKSTHKMYIDLNGYYTIAMQIINRFNAIAPYEKYSGLSELETHSILQEIDNLYS